MSLDRGLLVIVSPKAGNTTESPPLRPRWSSTGRLPVDVDVDQAVDLRSFHQVPSPRFVHIARDDSLGGFIGA